MFSLAIECFASWLDSVLYTGIVYTASWLPYQLEAFVLKGLFTVETSGVQESGECVFLLSQDHRVTRRLLFSEKRQYITSSVEEAVRWSKELDLPIQMVMCHHVEDYFERSGVWIKPQPYALVYQYGEVNATVDRSTGEYQLEFLQSRQGYRVYSPNHKEELAMLVAALLCSRHPLMMLYFLLRYQWYDGYCFGGLLAAGIVYEIVLRLIIG